MPRRCPGRVPLLTFSRGSEGIHSPDGGLHTGRREQSGAVTTTVGVRTAAPRVRDVLAVGRPAFWVVSVVPYYVGILLATHRLVPPLEEWPRLIVGAVGEQEVAPD